MIRPLKLLLQVKGVVCDEARKLASGRYAAELQAIRSHQPAVAFLGNAKKSGKHREVMTYIDTRMCPGVPRAALKRVAVMVSCGVHCAFRRTPPFTCTPIEVGLRSCQSDESAHE